MRKALVIGGIKHCGKSTLGRMTAHALHRPWRDTDRELERRNPGKTTRELFRELGEDEFRRREAEAVTDLIRHDNAPVISLGGGAASNPYLDWNELRKNCRFIFLNVPPETAYQRVLRRGLPPFLEKETDPHSVFLAQCENRIARYRELADLELNIAEERPPQETAARIVKAITEEFSL